MYDNHQSRTARKTAMQRSNNNSPISAGNTCASSAAGGNNSSKQTLSGTGRRTYNRSHNNNFKFHNFVFNETNQKFCLEEQHGNKKITVLHWKKTDEQQQPTSNPQIQQQQQQYDQLQSKKTEFIPTVRNCDSDSKLIKSDKLCYVSHFCKNDDEQNNDDNHHRRPDGDLLQEMDIHNERTAESLSTSTAATTTATMNTGLMASATFPLAYRSINSLQSAFESSQIKNDSSSSFLPHHPSENSSFISSGHSSGSFLFPLDSSSSSANNFNYAKNSDESISKSHYSGSSLATTSSSCSAINFSLDNLKLNENIYRNSANSRRKYNRVKHVLIEDDSEEEESDHSDFDDNNSRDLFFQTYREKIQQRIESLFEDTQSQPLDLSIKSKSNDFDLNNNKRIYEHSISIDNNEKDEAISGCESVDSFKHSRFNSPTTTIASTSAANLSSMATANKSDDSYFQWPSSSWMSESNVAHSSMRTESLSPSQLISSIKCSSPLSDRYAKSRSMSTSNPFIFSSERIKRFEPMERKESFSSSTSSTDLFDALLEEEIQKFLLNTNTSTFHHKRPANDLNKKIEDKLKLLQQEVLNNKLSESHLFDFISEPAKDDHLRMHFKFDSNKNLEPYLDNFKSRSNVYSLSNQMLSQTNTLPKSRLNHRNQIKRHMEDTFKQNGFLVKVFIFIFIILSINNFYLFI